MSHKRNRTPSKYIYYGLYFYFSGLSLGRASDRLSSCFIKRNHVSVWNWIQKNKPKKISSKRKHILEYVIDETVIKVGSNFIWLWIAIEPIHKEMLGISISVERNMFVAEKFISNSINIHGKHPISTDGGTWYPQACKFLEAEHHMHSPYEKSIVKGAIQHVKDRTEPFDDYFPCGRKKKCKLRHVFHWLNMFADFHNKELKTLK